MHELTGFQRDILFVIAGLDGPHGLAIKDELDSYYASEINHGRLYPNIDILVEAGLVNKAQADKRTNIYTLKAKGQEEIEARKEWEAQYLAEN